MAVTPTSLADLELWLALGASLGIGLLIGLERERSANAKAGLRTFALVSLGGTLAAMLGLRLENVWLLPTGLAAIAGMLIAAYSRDENTEDLLSALNLHTLGRLEAREAVIAFGLAFVANTAFKLGVMRWYGGARMFARALVPLGAAAAAGAAALFLI